MKANPNERDEAKRNEKAVTGRPESPQSRETFPERAKRPRQVGLANEARPGLGTRAEDEAKRNDPGADDVDRPMKTTGKPKATRYGYDEPLPEPREQAPNSFAHEEERSTGASGQSGL